MHSRKERRYGCTVCGATFAATKGTVFYRRHLPGDTVVKVTTLLAHGCPRQAIVAAFEVDERTVKSLEQSAGRHCQHVHLHLVEQPHDLGHVQAGEIRAKVQGGILWMALAIQVQTRLWLGGVLGAARDMDLITRLIQTVRQCARTETIRLCRALLFCVDGYTAYVGAIQHVFREPTPAYAGASGKHGRPRLRPWDGIRIAQVVKQYAQKRVVSVVRRVVQGTQAQVEALLRQTQGGGLINTAYVERLNATFRARLTTLVRRGRALVRQVTTLHHAMYLVGTVYNFCTYHQSLRVPLYLTHQRSRCLRRTPAIAAGITDHRWTVQELLSFRVPPPRWEPPRRRGRPSNVIKTLIAQWCT